MAVIEAGPAKDEARGFCQDAACSSTKFYRRYRCDQSGSFPCVITSNFPTTLEDVNTAQTDHATTVASAAVADYLDDQIAGQTLAFKLAATSGPREAKLIHLGALGGFGYPGVDAAVSFAEAFDVAASSFVKADIITGATFINFGPQNSNGGYDCQFPSLGKTIANEPWEMAAENAFDGGAFVAISPGNWCGPSATGFVSSSPAHLPKVFTVTGLNVTASGCNGDYRECKVSASSSIRGGAPAKIGAFTFQNALSIVDLAVPQNLTHFTRCSQFGNGSPCLPTGFVVTNGGDAGTSFAAPRLAGYAALVKDWFIQNGITWFNNPGWLHVTMLGQGDAHYSTAPTDPSTPTIRRTTGADPIYGLGRVKLRHPSQFAVYGHDFRSLTFTSTTPYTYFVGGVPLHSSTELLKCVMVGHEDMSHKDNIGRVRLEVRLRTPVAGQCSSSGSLVGSLIDNTPDVKHMVAFRGSNGQVGGRCAEVTIRPTTLPTTGRVWTQAFCYAASEEDDAPN